ncbi:putative adhesin [Streptomyces sp. NPDC049916]|uniref:putative adhesin n=1 Tax=Streptomyces sp. NPDC049916 TaxID=3155156 RepID=UPI00341B45A0
MTRCAPCPWTVRSRPSARRRRRGSRTDVKPTEIFGPGKDIPNYTMFPGTDLRMMSGSITVSKPTLLSDVLKPNMGPVHMAFCREHGNPR